jgi:hypothetical protein
VERDAKQLRQSQPLHRQCILHPFAQTLGCVGIQPIELVSRISEHHESGIMIALVVCLCQTHAHPAVMLLRQVLEYVALLVDRTPLDRRSRTKGIQHRPAESLASVENHQRWACRRYATFNDVLQERRDNLGVFRGSLPDTKNVLSPFGINA